MIVVDTNVVIYLFVPGPHQTLSEQVFRQDSRWAAPYLWRSEFCNALTGYLRHQVITIDKAKQILQKGLSLLQGREYRINLMDVLDLAATSNCSAYDCEFVALAQELGVPLVTADKKVLKEFPTLAVNLAVFVNGQQAG